MKCKIEFDFLSPHNGEYWYKCETCGARDWFAYYDKPKRDEPINGCKNAEPKKSTVWRDLKTDPPSVDEYAVLLFPCKSDIGVLYTVSNPHYARGPYALSSGYTHWCKFELAPNHEEMIKWQENLNDRP